MLFKFVDLNIDFSSGILLLRVTYEEVGTRYKFTGISAALLTDLDVVRLLSDGAHSVHDHLELLEFASVHRSSGGLIELFEG